MTSPAKLYAKLLDNPRATVSFRGFEGLIRSFGFVLTRIKGSHPSYRHDDVAGPLVVQPRGAEAVSYQVRDFLDTVREHDLTMDE